MFSPRTLLTAMLGLAGLASQTIVRNSVYSQGTYGKRSRIPGEKHRAGAKLAKAAARSRITIRGSVTGATLWALNRGKKAV